METFLEAVMLLTGLVFIYYGVRWFIINEYFVYNIIAKKRVFKLRHNTILPKGMQFFLLGLRRCEQLLEEGCWYRGACFYGKWKVERIHYIKWNLAEVLVSFADGNAMDVRLYQKEIDAVIPTTAPPTITERPSIQYDSIVSQYTGRVLVNTDLIGVQHLHHTMLDGTLVSAPSYELDVTAFINAKKPKKKYPQRRKHGVK